MKRVFVLLLCCAMGLTIVQAAPPNAMVVQAVCYIKPADFAAHKGTWSITSSSTSGSTGPVLQAPSSVPKDGAKPAAVAIEIEEAGTYYVWARSRDFNGGTDDQGKPLTQGTRNFAIAVNGNRLDTVFGKHGVNGWAWESGGAVTLNAGTNLIQLIDTVSYFGRCEAIAITSSPNFTGPAGAELTQALELNHAVLSSADKTAEILEFYESVASQYFYFKPQSFTELGTWIFEENCLKGLTTLQPSKAKPVKATFHVSQGGSFRLWVRDNDFKNDRPGIRRFRAAIDGVESQQIFGTHGGNGFQWTDGGSFTLEPGEHELTLIDSSANYARCEGVFITANPGAKLYENLTQMDAHYTAIDPLEGLPNADFPEWAVQDVSPAKTAFIENDQVKLTFYQGSGEKGSLVQNEIAVKENEQWVTVKEKTEELGFLMMTAASSKSAGQTGQAAVVQQVIRYQDRELTANTSNFFKSGLPVWFLPSDFTKVSDREVKLTFPNTEADLIVTFSLDELSPDPKVTLDVKFKENGAYSFLLYSGNSTAYEAFDTVTAPLLYVKKAVPATPEIVPECYLFTPMATLHYPQENGRIPGKELTSGIVIDPTCVPQDFAYPDTSRFGVVLRSQDGNVRPQFSAPMFGTASCHFSAGDAYSVSYRIVNQLAPWFDTYKHITQNIYQLQDLRSNYYTSLNDAIYNATDLMMDDDYGGWDSGAMAQYNMEQRDLTTVSNAMSAMQRYLLTEDENILKERAVPTLAYLLSRKLYHFKPTDSVGGATGYISQTPAPIGSPVSNYGTSVYGGLYEMTQGRMPFLLQYGESNASSAANFRGIADQGALYKYTGDPAYLEQVKAAADRYLATYPNAGSNREVPFVNGFVFGDYTMMVAAFVAAYELTGEQKYLDAAKDSADLLMTGLWTTGYQNDYAENTYTVDPDQTAERLLNCENYNFWWHGDKVWRLGNIDGQAKKPQDLPLKIPAENIPGWLSAKAGMGTEHPRTPGHGNVITMNNWAGNLVKLSVYTGEPYYEMQARNAMIGRFGNYPGYYQDRYISHQMQPDYPYVGPDYTSIYWHHIPVFISMLEDFLINEVWAKSNQNISFPSLYQMGYAYFASNQYGQAPGKFYDEEGMWLWLDRGIMNSDSVQIDYLAARKNGVLGLALMNESGLPTTTKIQLGEKVPGGNGFTGTAEVFDENGNRSVVKVEKGIFSLSIPAKGIRSVVLKIPGVKTPAYANQDDKVSDQLGETVTTHTRGKGHVIQVVPDSYYAYVYTSDMDDDVAKLTITYTVNGQEKTKEKMGYPYEFLIPVEDAAQAFTYTLKATKQGGAVEELGGGTLRTLEQTKNTPVCGVLPDKIYTAEELPLTIVYHEGSAVLDGVPVSSGYQITAENMERKTYTLLYTNPAGTETTIQFTVTPDLVVLKQAPEVNKNGGKFKVGNLTSQVQRARIYVAAYQDNRLVNLAMSDALQLEPGRSQDVTAAFPSPCPQDSVLYKYFIWTEQGLRPLVWEDQGKGFLKNYPVNVEYMGTKDGKIRFVINLDQIPIPVTENSLRGMHIQGTLTGKNDGTAVQYDSIIAGNEMRGGAQTVLNAEPTVTVPVKDYLTTQVYLTSPTIQ